MLSEGLLSNRTDYSFLPDKPEIKSAIESNNSVRNASKPGGMVFSYPPSLSMKGLLIFICTTVRSGV